MTRMNPIVGAVPGHRLSTSAMNPRSFLLDRHPPRGRRTLSILRMGDGVTAHPQAVSERAIVTTVHRPSCYLHLRSDLDILCQCRIPLWFVCRPLDGVAVLEASRTPSMKFTFTLRLQEDIPKVSHQVYLQAVSNREWFCSLQGFSSRDRWRHLLAKQSSFHLPSSLKASPSSSNLLVCCLNRLQTTHQTSSGNKKVPRQANIL